jgi:hypothetical protein
MGEKDKFVGCQIIDSTDPSTKIAHLKANFKDLLMKAQRLSRLHLLLRP